MIPGSKGQKSDTSLLAGGFLNLGPWYHHIMIHKEKEDLLLVPFDLSLIYKYMVSLSSF